MNDKEFIEVMQNYKNAVTQDDDSMSPYIEKGSTLFLKNFTENNFAMMDSAVYVFKSPNGLITRRYVILGNGKYELRADNKQYETIILNGEEIPEYLIVGRVIGRFTKV